MKFRSEYLWVFLLVLALVSGVVIGRVGNTVPKTVIKPPSAPVAIRENSLDFEFINPFIFSKTSKKFYVDECKELIDKFNSAIKIATENKLVDDVSVYFRDLNSGHWTGVNEDETYEPGSLLKTVVMIGTLKLALSNPGILSKNLDYNGPKDQGQYYKPNFSPEAGPQSVQELLGSMIIDSNNGAADSLLFDKNISNEFHNTYQKFLLPAPSSSSITDYMSPRGYSVVFRILYDSTYLTWDLSNQALELLSRTNFTKGLVAGVPDNITISHKFGEHTSASFAGVPINRQLHDCGIVYYPKSPYFLCIMTRGQDYSNLEKVIKDLSKIAYQYANSKP